LGDQLFRKKDKIQFGNIGDAVIENIKIPELKNRITAIIATKLGVKLGFDL
jgi:hypothetical protein